MQLVILHLNLFFSGLLAGEEFIICHAIRKSLAAIDDEAQIKIRQTLIRRLRILVPILFVATLLSTVVTLINAPQVESLPRLSGLIALIGFISITLFGTVPINKAALAWNPVAPPADWKKLVLRWERLDIARCWLAILAFAFFLFATAYDNK